MSPSDSASSSIASSRLFSPVKLGSNKSIHRVALAPLTRFRTYPSNQVASELAGTYYEQRASKGGLLISETCFISVASGGWPLVPGIWTAEQVNGWKDATSRVHAKGGFIFCQLGGVGRANVGSQAGIEVVSASALALKGTDNVPRALTVEEIAQYVQDFRQAALNAIEAGFDGVEIHDANGYLLDQFLQSVSNKRTDAYGGNIEGRSQFLSEVVQAVTDAIGQERVGIKFSPWSTFQDMQEKNPVTTTFGYVTKELVARFPKLGYLHFLEAAAWGAEGQKTFDTDGLEDGLRASNDYFRAIVRGIDPSTIPDDDSFVFPDPDEAHPLCSWLLVDSTPRQLSRTRLERGIPSSSAASSSRIPICLRGSRRESRSRSTTGPPSTLLAPSDTPTTLQRRRFKLDRDASTSMLERPLSSLFPFTPTHTLHCPLEMHLLIRHIAFAFLSL